ncbi:spore coat protein CotH [Streptomyces lycii]|uniref:Spore coat protein CotH n=2 Tax=Streptomyces lycii TaxID=2654337 RepID=A0ABQ7FEB3_9ACTN|nr:spore coat protein CotH [Streptomyces lycii]
MDRGATFVRKKRMSTLSLLAALSLLMTAFATAEGSAAPQPDAVSAHAPAGAGTAAADDGTARQNAAARQQAEDELTGDITFSVPSGTFQGQVSVSLGTSVANAEIRYTTDGELPTASSPLYSGPLEFTGTTELRALPFVDGLPGGEPGTQIYVARSVDADHDLPLLVMDAYGAGKPDREWADVSAMVMEPQGGTTSLSAAPAVATRAGFHLRGQSSASFEKAPYRLELRGNDDDDAKYPLLGMPADGDWVLRGPFPDKTLIRDAFAYTLGEDMGLAAPGFRFVEVYLNLDGDPLGADDYQGVYMLDEQIERGPDRVDIQKLEKEHLSEPEITGGYIFKFDALAAEEPKVPCTGAADTCWSDLEVVEPDDLEPAQLDWLAQHIQKFHDSLRSANPADPQTGYPAYIDEQSFIDRIIHNELAREGDSYIRSTHFYKDRGGKIVAGPLWDYDLGYNAVPFGGMDQTTGWQFEQGSIWFQTTDWFLRLMEVPEFNAKVKARWEELRRGVLSDNQLRQRVTDLATPIANGARRNFEKWPNLNVSQVGPFPTQTTETWEEQLELMRTFLVNRAAWIDRSGWELTEGGGQPLGQPWPHSPE